MASENILTGSIEDIIFENRNKSYGAYDIRKKYTRYVQIGFAIAVGIAILVILLPYIMELINKRKALADAEKIEAVATLTEPPPTNKELPPPPEIKIPVPEQIRFVPPKIVETVKKEEEIHTVEEVKQSTNVGSEDVKGDKEVVTEPVKEIVQEDNSIHDLVSIEKQPEFPGGDDALLAFIKKNVRYPAAAVEFNIMGTVYVKFIVEKDGKVDGVTLGKGIRGNDGGCNAEAMRVVALLPNFKPAMQNGRPVRVYYNVPIKFQLQ